MNEIAPTDNVAQVDREQDGRGLAIDMLDVDRLREWARLLLVHGPDISHWGSVQFVASKLQIIATCMEHTIRDVGSLRDQIYK